MKTNKKSLLFAALAMVLGLSFGVPSIRQAVAKSTDQWPFARLYLDSTQNAAISSGTVTNLTVTTLTGPSQWNTISSFTVTGAESVGTTLAVTGTLAASSTTITGYFLPQALTKAQLCALAGALGQTYQVSDDGYNFYTATGTSAKQWLKQGTSNGCAGQ